MADARARARALALAALLAAGAVGAAPAAAEGPLGPVEPGPLEQEGVWALNRARHDPALYGDEIGLDLSGIPPSPPLAVSPELTGSARFHAREMLEHDYFAHTSAVTGDGPNAMVVENGYDLFGFGLDFDWGAGNNVESIAFGLNRVPDALEALALLVIDDGVVPPGHRMHLLAADPSFAEHTEVGFGRAAAGPAHYYAIHTGYSDPSERFVTGVAYRDLDGDGAYDRGEGLGGVTVEAGGLATTTMAEGGYAIPVAPGSHVVRCSGGPFAGAALAVADVRERNVEVDCIEGLPVGEVDFGFQSDGDGGGGPELLDVAVAASTDRGPAPVTAELAALGGAPDTVWIWDFGDGTGDVGADAVHTWLAPGVYPVVLRGASPDGAGAALRLVSVSGPAGAGAGTAAPDDLSLRPVRLKAGRDLAESGRDSVDLVADLELPAGFVPGGQPVQVSVLGATLDLTLDAGGKARDGAGNELRLRPRRARLGGGARAGRLTVKLQGDLADALGAAGLRDATEERVLSDLPIAFVLDDLVYRGSADAVVESRAGEQARARLAP